MRWPLTSSRGGQWRGAVRLTPSHVAVAGGSELRPPTPDPARGQPRLQASLPEPGTVPHCLPRQPRVQLPRPRPACSGNATTLRLLPSQLVLSVSWCASLSGGGHRSPSALGAAVGALQPGSLFTSGRGRGARRLPAPPGAGRPRGRQGEQARRDSRAGTRRPPDPLWGRMFRCAPGVDLGNPETASSCTGTSPGARGRGRLTCRGGHSCWGRGPGGRGGSVSAKTTRRASPSLACCWERGARGRRTQRRRLGAE